MIFLLFPLNPSQLGKLDNIFPSEKAIRQKPDIFLTDEMDKNVQNT